MGSSNIPHEARQAIQRLVGDAKPEVDRPPTLVLAIDQAEELFANATSAAWTVDMHC
jgi:hypothetical protein